jgi:hypothetical protein
MTKISQKISLILAFSLVAVFGAQSLLTKAQTVAPSEYYNAVLNITPDMTSAPLFKSTTPIAIALTGYQSTADMSPVAGAYTCTFEARAMQDRTSNAAWTSLASNVAYDPATGCSAQMTKTTRQNGLNWSFRVTVTSVTDSTLTHAFFSEYAFTFQGAGVASGN